MTRIAAIFEDSAHRARRPRAQAAQPRRRVPPPHRPPGRGRRRRPSDRRGAGVMTTAGRPARRPAASSARRSAQTGLLRQSLAIVRRNLIHIKRMPEMLMDVTIQPVMFVLLFAFVFGGSIAVPGSPAGYREWLLAGIMGADDRLRVVHRRRRPDRRHRQGHRRPDAVAADQPGGRAGRAQHLEPDALQHRHRGDVADRPAHRLADPRQLRRRPCSAYVAAAAVGLRDDLGRHPGRLGDALGRGGQRADVHRRCSRSRSWPTPSRRPTRCRPWLRTIAEWNPISCAGPGGARAVGQRPARAGRRRAARCTTRW